MANGAKTFVLLVGDVTKLHYQEIKTDRHKHGIYTNTYRVPEKLWLLHDLSTQLDSLEIMYESALSLQERKKILKRTVAVDGLNHSLSAENLLDELQNFVHIAEACASTVVKSINADGNRIAAVLMPEDLWFNPISFAWQSVLGNIPWYKALPYTHPLQRPKTVRCSLNS
jgi:hypothetical protein